MTDKATDKKAESILALKNANKHLAELFTDLNKKDAVLQTCANDLANIARQCGEIRIETWVGNERKIVLFKTYLETIIATLNGART